MMKRWNILAGAGDETKALADALGVSDVLARLLWNRGLRTKEAAEVFLDPEHRQPFYDPFLLTDMKTAVERIASALKNGEHITIYGDYDVDGMTASSLLYHCLHALGAAEDAVEIYIPDRFREGYGMNAAALAAIAERSTLLVSVDCGISCADEIATVQDRLDIVVTDHHLPGDVLPACVAVVNPHRADDTYPDKNLAGVGVAFKLCDALSRTLRGTPWTDSLELVALGTVADVVPLVGENRKIVRMGMARMKDTENPGLAALIAVSSTDAANITSDAIGFQLAPRLNAAGRMKSAMLGARLLTTTDKAEAEALAAELNALNQERQSVEHDIQAMAESQLAGTDANALPALVLAGEGWHPGVIGIVASRLVEKYYKPTILLSIDGDVAKGSCRSIPGLHMHDALAACASHLLKFGGHAQAAGLSLHTKDIDAFRAAFSDYADAHLTPDDYVPRADIEFEMHPASVTIDLVEEIAQLEPYGEGNAKPLFGVRDVRSSGAWRIGKEQQHLKFAIDSLERSVQMLYWNQGSLAGFVLAEPLDIVYRPAINDYMGRRSVQGFVDSLQPAESACIFPDRTALANLYRYLLQQQKTGGKLPLDPWRLCQDCAHTTGVRLPLYTMQQALCIFTELHILTTPLDETGYRLVVPEGKLDLMASPTYRSHQMQ